MQSLEAIGVALVELVTFEAAGLGSDAIPCLHVAIKPVVLPFLSAAPGNNECDGIVLGIGSGPSACLRLDRL